SDFYKGLDHLQTRADLLNHYQYVLGTPDGAERDVERYRSATTASVRDAFARAPAVAPLPAVLVPSATQFTLSNGLPIVAIHRDVAPIVSMALMIRSGSAADVPEQAGLASLTAEMMDEGAGQRDALEFADALEHLGADLWVGTGRDGSQLSVQSPRETFFEALDLAGDVLCRPRLADADWQRVLSDRRTSTVQRRDQPEAVV